MFERFKYDRMEPAGSLGDLGTLLPIAIAVVAQLLRWEKLSV
ncbi:hypothetical protein [Desulfoglaeba alkanexedens]|jgi:SulP family sulfate permease|nr:hypothetical protein [Desulfoglaeba alkanexedens]